MREKLYGLQALRALAASLVIFAHALSTYRDKIFPAIDGYAGGNLGDIGVKIFFCISGFIICHSSYTMPAGMVSAVQFLWRRAVRIVPLYWVATGIYTARLAAWGETPGWREVLASLLFVPYGAAPKHPVLGAGWTLNFEVLFYLAFGISLLLKRPVRIYLFLAIFAALGLAQCAGWLSPPGDAILLGALDTFADIYLVYFIFGVLLGLGKLRFSKLLDNIGMPPGYTVMAAMAVVFICLWWLGHIHGSRLNNELIILACVSVSVFICITEKAPAAYLVSAPVRWLGLAGDASYSSYLTHGFVMGPIARLIAVLRLEMPVNVFAAGMVLVATGVGVVIYRWFERPLLRRFGKPPLLAKTGPSKPAPPPRPQGKQQTPGR
jgi:exopolysaccharide production protein ExoZ